MSLFDQIKKDIKKSASSKGKILFLKPDSEIRIRFLMKFEQGLPVIMHDNFEKGVNSICYEHVGKECPTKIHDKEGVRTRENYAWCVYDYDSKEVKIILFAANNFTPIPQLAAFYDSYKNIIDRDYVIQRNAKGKGYNVIPQDKAVFRNTKVKPFSKSKMFEYIYEANHLDDEDEEDVSNDTGWEDESDTDYSSMTAKELFELCKEREIEVLPKKPVKYYIDLLEANDIESDDGWDDESEEEEKPDYSSMTAKELFELCKERKLEAKIKKPVKYYIDLLETDDENDDVPWEEDEKDDDEW